MLIAGVDEAGRGSIAGPVVSAVVTWELPGLFLKESKSLTASERNHFYKIVQNRAVACSIGIAEVEEIDILNIKEATLLSMKRAVDSLRQEVDVLIVDGWDLIKNINTKQIATTKGDYHNPVVAAASIIAKVTRDQIMNELANLFPVYHWHTNKGYATLYHLEMLKKHGLTIHHRKTFIHEK